MESRKIGQMNPSGKQELRSVVEKGLVGAEGEREVRANWKSSADIHTVPCVRQTAHGRLLCNAGSSAGCSEMI